MDAASKRAEKLLKEHTNGKEGAMTAMGFCRLVLDEGLGFQNWGVIQLQRIVISKARKEILGKKDARIIKAPPKACSLQLPCTSKSTQKLSKELFTDNATQKKSIESELDADTLQKKGIFLIPNFVQCEDVVNIL